MHRDRLKAFVRVAIVTGCLLAICLATPTPSDGGIKLRLYKAKESVAQFNSNGQKIQVWEFTPSQGTGPFPGVAVLYGLDCLDELPKSEVLYRNVAGLIADGGFHVHFVHYFNSTPFTEQQCQEMKTALLESVPKLNNHSFDPKVESAYLAWVAAAKDGVELLRQHKNVKKDKIGVVGLSMGGFVGTSLAVQYPELNISAIINVFGGLPPPQMDKVRKEKLKMPPMLIMGAEDDDIVPERVQRELFQLLRETGNRGEAHFYGDVGHAFIKDKKTNSIDLNMVTGEALPLATRFLKRHLQGK